MKFDIFLSICQTEVDGYMPKEKEMFLNFFDQVALADELGFGTAWVAETHLSCQVQKENPEAVIPHFKGEIGLNTDILQVAHLVFAKTKRINVGSAIRNIICNGGPLAHAEAVRTFLSLNSLNSRNADRRLELGFAAGRFPFSNLAYGIRPRNEAEAKIWDVLKNKVFTQATEIFLRFLKGERFSIRDVAPMTMSPAGEQVEPIASFYNFDKVGVIPFESPLDQLRLTIGSHDPEVQNMANQFLPVGVFNLSITSPEVIEETHSRMKIKYNKSGGTWKRELMPRTVLLFIDNDSQKAKAQAERAWKNYWVAMEKTLDPEKVKKAVHNAIAGNPKEVVTQIREKYHPEDRLMLWFDFNNHNNEEVKASMKLFIERVAPELA